MNLNFDLDELTLGDMADLEEIAGIDVLSMDKTRLGPKQILALVWVFRRQEEPSFTYDDARKLKPRDLSDVTFTGDLPTLAVEGSSTPGGGELEGESASSS
jgi:hypothetical protein